MSRHSQFWTGQAGLEEKCDGCGEIKLLQQIELQGHQLLCHKCREAQPVRRPMPKIIRLTATPA